MKKFQIFSLFLFIPSFLYAQNEIADAHQLFQGRIVVTADSLKAILARSANDENKVGLLGHLCYYYAFIRPDTGLLYGQQGLQLSNKLSYKRGTAYCNQSLSFCLWAMGKYNEALTFALNSLKQYEDLGDYKRIAYSYLALANVYRETGDFEKALKEAHTAIKINDSNKFPLKVSFAVIGSIYERQNKSDSALIYIQKAYELDIIQNDGNWGWLVYVLGNIEAKLKHYDIALAYYKLALPLNYSGSMI
jgi:two-component system NtrC family sensor kinase